MRNLVIAGVVILVALIALLTSLYVVDETEQVVVTRFGDVQAVHTTPGLRVKAPFGVDRVITFDRRVLRIDAPPGPFLDKDINILEIDVYARYVITDPHAFLQALTTQENAGQVLGQRINAALRAEIAERSREEIIGGDVALDSEGNPITDDEGNSVVNPTNTRTEILDDVLARVQDDLLAAEESFGVEMIDVPHQEGGLPTGSGRPDFRAHALRPRKDRPSPEGGG